MTLEEIERELQTLACSDGGCCIRKPVGMATNGGCVCIELKMTPHQRIKLRRALHLRQEQVRLLKGAQG